MYMQRLRRADRIGAVFDICNGCHHKTAAVFFIVSLNCIQNLRAKMVHPVIVPGRTG